MGEELKPCPFCGSPSVTTQARHPSILPYFVECSTCDARGARREDREAAIAAWNLRAEDDPVAKKILKGRIAQNMLLQNGNARLRERIATLEAENAALRSMLGICRKCKIGGMMCWICERRIESEECGCDAKK